MSTPSNDAAAQEITDVRRAAAVVRGAHPDVADRLETLAGRLDHARATAPGDDPTWPCAGPDCTCADLPAGNDRGRELARRLLSRIDHRAYPGDGGFPLDFVLVAPVERVTPDQLLDRLRALAAPAETEVGGCLTCGCVGFTATPVVVAGASDWARQCSCGHPRIAHVRALAATPPAPDGEAGTARRGLGDPYPIAQAIDGVTADLDASLSPRADLVRVLLDVANTYVDRLIVEARTWSLPAPGEGQGATEGGELLQELFLALTTVQPHLSQPYPDDPRWTPWSRWIEPVFDRLCTAISGAVAGTQAESAGET